MDEDSSDVIIEYLEVFINYILYVRELYPKQIFKKYRIYNAPVYISIYPPLNDYILKSLTAARQLKWNKALKKVQIVIYSEDLAQIYEKYVFEINDNYDNSNLNSNSNNKSNNNIDNTDKDYYLIKFEEDLRKSLLTLENRLKILNKLPNGAIFKIHLFTTQSAFIKMSHNPDLEEFPWVQEADSDTYDYQNKISILPLAKAYSTGIRVFVEKC